MNKLERVIALGMLLFAICFNLWLYRAEPTAMVDPNDNAFQYALVERTNVIWDYANRACRKGETSNIAVLALRSFSEGGCHLALLIDHWVPNWAEGYNLPYYYSHVPQIVIVGTYRLLSIFRLLPSAFSIFQYYHWLIYLLLCFFPLSVFLALRSLGEGGSRSWLTAGIGALLASHISTDGLYGIDPASFLWRGWGLSSQLFAMIFMPLALAYAIRWMNDEYTAENGVGEQFFKELKICLQKIVRINHTANLHLVRGKELQDSDIRNRASLKNSLPNPRAHDFLYAIIFITATTMGHLGMGLMLFFTLPVIAFTRPFLSFLHQQSFKTIWGQSKEALLKVIVLALPPLVLLSYWIIPTFLDSAYHNVSFWDPVWKFNSYGAKEVLVNLWNGSLFDWGRLPVFTALVFIGLFVCLKQKTENGGQRTDNFQNYSQFSAFRFPLSTFSFLFLFFLLLYFGKTTWGGILDFIPGMNEFHQHRFIVGVHLIGLFLAPIGAMWIVERIRVMSYELGVRIKNKNILTSYLLPLTYSLTFVILSITLCFLIYPQTILYGEYNQTLIEKANATYLSQKADAELLLQTLRELMKDDPGRVFAGRGGGWGKNFSVAESAYFMYLSTYGIPTILWLPETWSLNSDTEQYFSENNPSHYELFNVHYVVAPARNASGIADAGGPPLQKPQPFWTFIKETDHWKLYGVSPSTNLPTSPSSYITSASSPSVVYSDKLSFGNVVRLWIQSDYPEKNIFPELRLTGKNPASQGRPPAGGLRSYTQLPHFWMLDEASYITPDAKTHSLFAEPPVYISPFGLKTEDRGQKTEIPITIINQSNDTDMVFRATIKVSSSSSSPSSAISLPSSVSCPTCVVVLKQTYHPSWRATIRKISPSQSASTQQGESTNLPISPSSSVPTINVFPSYVAVRLEEPGNYEVVFTYTPSKFKMLLLFGGIIMTGLLFYVVTKKRK